MKSSGRLRARRQLKTGRNHRSMGPTAAVLSVLMLAMACSSTATVSGSLNQGTTAGQDQSNSDSGSNAEPSDESGQSSDSGADDPGNSSNDGSSQESSVTQNPEDVSEETMFETTAEGRGRIESVITDPEELAKFGGTLRYLIESDVDGLNPRTSALSAPGLTMTNAVFDTLAVFDQQDQWQPYLAESITSNEDFTSWTIKLREGVLFHDGTPLNAEALVVNLEVGLDDPLVGIALEPLFPNGVREVVTIVDYLTVRYDLARPTASFPSTLTDQIGYVASPTWLLAALEDPQLNQAPVGTGPFVFDARSEDSVTRFVRNENWWKGPVYLDAIEFVPSTDPSTRGELFKQGEGQALQVDAPGPIVDLIQDPELQHLFDDTGEEVFVMLNAGKAPFDDIRVRKALTFATPRQNFLDLITGGLGTPATHMFAPSSSFYVADIVQEADLPEQAGPLIAEYCSEVPAECSDGKVNIELHRFGPSVIQTRTAELLDQGWKDFFNVKFQEQPQDSFIQNIVSGNFDATLFRLFGSVNPVDDQTWLRCTSIDGSLSLNWARFCDEERDALFDQLDTTQDQGERIRLFEQVVRKINQDYLYVFLAHAVWDNVYANNVRGVCAETTPEGVLMRCSVNGRTWHSSLWFEN